MTPIYYKLQTKTDEKISKKYTESLSQPNSISYNCKCTFRVNPMCMNLFAHIVQYDFVQFNNPCMILTSPSDDFLLNVSDQRRERD